MEKFGAWRDAFTGLHPFLPTVHPRRSFIPKIGSLLFGFVLFCVRLPFIILAVIALVIRSMICAALSLHIGNAFIRRPLDTILLRPILLLLGVWSIDTSGFSNVEVKKTDIVATRLTSFVDVLLVAYEYSPSVFLFPTQSGELRAVGLFNALAIAMKPSAGLTYSGKLDTGKTLKELVAKYGGPLALFGEGVPTNGSAVLPFLPAPSVYDVERVIVFAAKHSYTFPIASPLSQLSTVFFGVGTKVQVRSDVIRTPSASDVSMGRSKPLSELVPNSVARVAGVPLVALAAKQKLSFIELFNKR